MKRAALMTVLIGWTAVTGAQLVIDGLRQQQKIQQRLVDQNASALADQRAQLVEAWQRVERGTGELIRAQRQSETLDSLQLRDGDLRQAESDLLMHVSEAQRLRRALLEGTAAVVAMEDEIQRLGGEAERRADPLTGNYKLVIGPTGHEGTMYLELRGTLVEGTYELDGRWTGSMRGTFVSGKVRLERIDSQIGFAAIYNGRLVQDGGEARLQGTWEATQLSSGLPSAGTWVATKAPPDEE